MPKLELPLEIKPNKNHPGRMQCNRLPREELKKYPGVDKYADEWLVPAELLDPQSSPQPYEDAALHPYQCAAIADARQHRRFAILFEMGLGKTVTAIKACEHLNRILVVCPAISKQVWVKEFQKWTEREDVHVHERGKDDIPTTGCTVVSYHLLHTVKGGPWEAIIFDEAHYLSKATTKWWKAARAHSGDSPHAMVLTLSGTAIPNEVIDLWGQLEVLCPGRFGTYWQFAHRYTNVQRTQYGQQPKGSKREDELRDRLAFFSSRVTRNEVAHLLPATPAPQSIHTSDKPGKLRALVSDNVDADRIAVLCHRRDSVKKYAKLLAKGDRPVYVIDGSMTPKQRHKVLEEMEPRALLVATFHSINVSVDLTSFPVAIWAELYSRPSVMLQSAGRFIRLSGLKPVQLYFLIEEFSHEASIAILLAEKIKSMTATIAAGAAEDVLDGALNNDAGFDEWVQSQIGAQAEWDEYL